jgi:hypothetical protein
LSWLFGRRGLSDLITCMVSAQKDHWTVIWVSDGRAPAEFTGKSLSEAVDRATQTVAALYSSKPQASTAELQFAIYPWPGGGQVIMELESLVVRAQQSLPDFRTAMFRWVRPIRELDTPPTAS